MGSYFLGESFVLLAVYLSTVKKNQPGHNGGKWFGWMIFAAMVIMTPKNLTKLIPQYFVKDTGYLTIVPEYQIQAEYLNECVEEGARVEVVDTLERQDRDLVFLGYYTDGIFVNVSYMDVLNIDYEQDEEKRRAFMERLVKADYLYVKETSASFDGYFSRYNQDQPFRKGEVLRVLHEASGIVFQPVQ